MGWMHCYKIAYTQLGRTYFIVIVWKFTDPFMSSVNNAEYWNFNLRIVSIPYCYTRFTCCLWNVFCVVSIKLYEVQKPFPYKFCHITDTLAMKIYVQYKTVKSRIWRILNVLFDICPPQYTWQSETNGYH